MSVNTFGRTRYRTCIVAAWALGGQYSGKKVATAAKMGLPWRASSRGLALERGVNNVGPMRPRKYWDAHQRALRHAYQEASVTGVPMFAIGEQVLTGLQGRKTLEAVIAEERKAGRVGSART